MRAVGRILVAITGFVLALIAATAFFVAVAFGLATGDPQVDGPVWAEAAIWVAVIVSTFGAALFLPAAAWILISEILGIRALLAHLLVGGLFGLVAALGLGAVSDDPRMTILIADGFVGAFVYWVVAGRTAGLVGAERPSTSEVLPPGR